MIDSQLGDPQQSPDASPERPGADSEFEIRRATKADFPRIFELVDRVFARKTSRAAYDWRYLDNPTGIARCWLVFHRASGQLVASHSRFPWPVAHGGERLDGAFGGDVATLPEFQRKGLYRQLTLVRDAHPAEAGAIVLGAPNVRARGAIAKLGLSHTILGPLPRATLVLDGARFLGARFRPRRSGWLAGRSIDATLALWRQLALPSHSKLRTEELRQFDASVDDVMTRTMSSAGYWCPHDADFLNWRYIRNPLHDYIALAARVGDDLEGYSVVRLEDHHAEMMEFAAGPTDVAGELLRATIKVAREAGCATLSFFSTRQWRHWRLLHRAGFLKTKREVYRSARCAARADVSIEENWQLLPGDTDVG